MTPSSPCDVDGCPYPATHFLPVLCGLHFAQFQEWLHPTEPEL